MSVVSDAPPPPRSSKAGRWLDKVVETNDALRFVGESSDQQFIAAGLRERFTLGTLT
jgi:hypothetical protein